MTSQAVMTSETVEGGDARDPRDGCCWQGQTFLNALKAMITRLIFLLHAMLVAWRASYVTQQPLTWLLSLLYAALIVENLYVLLGRKGNEWKWFSPCVFLYLLSVVPGIWLLELTNVDLLKSHNTTTDASTVVGLTLAISLEQWAWILQQMLVVFIIIGRWLLPKGELSREQLSSLLLNYVGIASDIIDFFNILAEDEALKESSFFYVILSLWSWSMLQFTFVRTAVSSNAMNDDLLDNYEENENDAKDARTTNQAVGDAEGRAGSSRRSCHCGLRRAIRALLETEAWAILIGLLMQDGPFFLTRLVAIFKYRIFSNSNFFFTVKNALVLILQIYRLVVIYHENEVLKKKVKADRSKLVLRELYKHAFMNALLKNSRANALDGLHLGQDYSNYGV